MLTGGLLIKEVCVIPTSVCVCVCVCVWQIDPHIQSPFLVSCQSGKISPLGLILVNKSCIWNEKDYRIAPLLQISARKEKDTSINSEFTTMYHIHNLFTYIKIMLFWGNPKTSQKNFICCSFPLYVILKAQSFVPKQMKLFLTHLRSSNILALSF